MANMQVGTQGSSSGERLLRVVAAQGSAAHPYLAGDALLRGPDCARNLSDAIHFLCILHGRYPGAVDHAADRSVDAPARAWFAAATEAFAAERALLARLAVAAGPAPSTAGAGDNQAAVLGQRHAIEMLAASERTGCALGAALAIVADWSAVRGVLDAAARRFAVESGPYAAGDTAAIRALADGLPAPAERALLFGAEQVAIQHFGLWDLLEARAGARGKH